MNNLLEKARAGRTNALAAIATNMSEAITECHSGDQVTTTPEIDPIPFISRRTHGSSAGWLH